MLEQLARAGILFKGMKEYYYWEMGGLKLRLAGTVSASIDCDCGVYNPFQGILNER